MALKTFVLISSVNNLSDARYCAGMDVDLIGFSMEEGNKNYISPEVYKELIEWLSGVEFVGEFENTDATAILDILKKYDTSFVQITQPSLVGPLKAAGLTVLLRQNINNLDTTVKPDYFIVESNDEIITDEHIEKIKAISGGKVLIGFGLSEENVETILDKTNAHGIALSGGDEIKPGYKDYDELADILETLEIDDLA